MSPRRAATANRSFDTDAQVLQCASAHAPPGRLSTSPSGLMEVRAPLPAELPAVEALLSEHGWAHRIPDADWLQQLLTNSHAVVAVSGGDVVGFARAVTDGLSNGYLSMVVVAEAHRRQGLGSRLVHAVMGAETGITWVLRAERPGARQFFERLGFKPSSSAMELARGVRHET